MKTTVIDLSGGNSHIREIAAESGIDHLAYHSNEGKMQINGQEIEFWYDEDSASAYAWHAWIKGVGSRSGTSKEGAIESILEMARENK